MIAINNMPDHLHLLIGFNPAESIAEIMRKVKGDSSEWINREKLTKDTFAWQSGYGAFSCGRKGIKTVAKYVENQQEHHRHQRFVEAFRETLVTRDIDFKEAFLFEDLKD